MHHAQTRVLPQQHAAGRRAQFTCCNLLHRHGTMHGDATARRLCLHSLSSIKVEGGERRRGWSRPEIGCQV
jgi:hypothetical protein